MSAWINPETWRIECEHSQRRSLERRRRPAMLPSRLNDWLGAIALAVGFVVMSGAAAVLIGH